MDIKQLTWKFRKRFDVKNRLVHSERYSGPVHVVFTALLMRKERKAGEDGVEINGFSVVG